MNSLPPTDDPLFGNAASDLLDGALAQDATQPVSDPRFWQPPTPEELQSRLSGYVIEAFLARGGMGAVYRGVQTSLERPVAIKILPPQLSEHDVTFAQRFKQEARAMALLNHPSIVKVFDFGEMSDGTLFFVMEFVEGTDVAQMMARQGRLSSAHAMAITAHVCDALQYAHELGVVHRDIKPANIMVGIDGTVKVADFGLAKSSQSSYTSLTVTGHVMGTLHFVAPEALTQASSVDHRADIYAVGVMLYQMLTGRLPRGIFELPSLLVHGLDPRFDPIVASAMREDRNARYQSIREMRRALDDLLTRPLSFSTPPAQTAPASPETAPPRSQPAKPNAKISHAGTWWLAFATVLVLGGLLWLKLKVQPWSPSSQATPAPLEAAVEPAPVSLPLVPEGGLSRMGGYTCQHASTGPTAPALIRKAPAGLLRAEYGIIKLGPPTRQREHAFIIDQVDSPQPRFFFDSNADGDLTNDPPGQWERRTRKANDGTDQISASGSFSAEIALTDGRPTTLRLRGHSPVTKPENRLHYYPDYIRAGTLTLAGQTYSALLCDDHCQGDFSAPTSSLRIDLNGDGSSNWRGETFQVRDAFNIGGTNYEIADLTPDGATFHIIRSTRTAPETKPLPVLGTGKQAIPFDATTLDGTQISMPSSYKGKVLLLDFWATWCPPCVEDVPHVLAAYQKHHAAGLEILGISLDEDKAKLTAFLKEKIIPWPQVCDGQGWKSAISTLYNVQSIPTTFLIDGDTGLILAKDARGTGLEPAIAKALAEKKR